MPPSSSSTAVSSSLSRTAVVVVSRQRLSSVVVLWCFLFLTLSSSFSIFSKNQIIFVSAVAETQQRTTTRTTTTTRRQQQERQQPPGQQIRKRLRQQQQQRQQKAKSRSPPVDPTLPFGPKNDFSFFMEFDKEDGGKDDIDDESETNNGDGDSDSSSISNGTAVANNPKIVGGETAATSDFRFFVQGKGCGASLIAPDMILSAAHCFGAIDYVPEDTLFPQKQPAKQQGVWVGAHQSRNPAGGAQQRRFVAELIHPLYDDDAVTHDFLIAKLDIPVQGIEPVPFSGNEQSLPTNPYPPPAQPATSIGFGAVFTDGPAPKELQEVQLVTISDDKCNQIYNPYFDQDVHLCAGKPPKKKKKFNKKKGSKKKKKGGGNKRARNMNQMMSLFRKQQGQQRQLKGKNKKSVLAGIQKAQANGFVGVCNGDSGGPLLYDGVQVGIVSFGYMPCGAYPAVYSRISAVSDWIREQVCWYSSQPPEYCFTSSSSFNNTNTNRLNTTNTTDPTETEQPLPAYFPIHTTRVDFQFDYYSDETTWSIFPQNNPKEILLGYPLDFGRQKHQHSTDYIDQFQANTTYILSVQDSYGDGVSNGYINIAYIDSATNRTSLLNYSLDFAFSNINVTFTTPASLLSNMD